MSSPRTDPRRALALAGVAGLVGTAVLAAATPAQAASCSATKVSSMQVTGRATETEFHTYIDYSGVVTTSPKVTLRSTVNVGYDTVTVTACKNSTTKKWQALSTSIGVVPKDLDLTISGTRVTQRPHSGSVGYGVFVDRVTATTVDIQAMTCRKSAAPISGLGVAHGVLGLPLPIPTPYAVGAYVLDKVLPAPPSGKYYCGQLGSNASIPWSFSSTGVATLHMPSSGQYVRNGRATWTDVCPAYRYCGTTDDQTVLIRKGT